MGFDPNRRNSPMPPQMGNMNPYYNPPQKPKNNGMKIILGVLVVVVLVLAGFEVAMTMNTNSNGGGSVEVNPNANVNTQNITEVEIYNTNKEGN